MTSSKPLRPGDSYQALVYVPRPTDTQLKRSDADYPGYTQDFLELKRAAARRVRRPRGPGDGQAAGPDGRRPLRPLRHRRRGRRRVAQRLRRRAGRRPGHGRLALRPALRAHPADQARHEDALRVRAGRHRPRPGGDHLRREPAAAPLSARGLPLRHQERLLPAVLRRDGAHAAHGRRARAGRVGLQPRQLQQRAQGLRRARHRRALVGRGLLPALRLDHLRPDARRVAGHLAARRRRPERQRRARPCRPTSAGAWASRATARSRPATPAPASRPPTGAAAGSCPSAPRSSRSWPSSAASALAPAHAVRRRSRPRWPSCSARCTAPGATRRPT